jgi:hypothetical protein
MVIHTIPGPDDRVCPKWSGVGCISHHTELMSFWVNDPSDEEYEIKVPCPCHDGAGCVQEGFIPTRDDEVP